MAILSDDLTNYSTVSNSRIQTSLEELESYIQGSIENSDISSRAAIDTSKLSRRNYEFDVNIHLTEGRGTNDSGDIIGIAPFPYDSGGGVDYVVESITGVVADTGATACTMDICFGNISGTFGLPTETNTTVLVNEISGIGANNNYAQVGPLTLSGSGVITQSSSSPKCFYVRVGATTGTAILAGSSFTLRVRRRDGLRSA